ncbi:MAG: glycogen synthase GlgA [Corallococcus sp.]|nr:glycogen synthase GlgA [Corallococcus sp.]
MTVFYVSAEVEPFAKTGGMGDVMGALPKAVARCGHDCYVVMPKYMFIEQKYKDRMEYIGYYFADVNWRHQYCGVFMLRDDGVNYIFLDNEFYFGGNQMYCFADNERFAFLCKAALDLPAYLQVKADVIHCNDWSAGWIPVLYDAFYKHNGFYKDTKIVYTIHNIAYQGKMGKEEAQDLTGLPDWYFTYDRLLHGDCVNVMKGAIVFSHAVTTVSPTYAEEIQTAQFGEGLEEVIKTHSHKICGVINGVDYGTYSPSKDKLIFKKYTKRTVFDNKAVNKENLQRQLGLPVRSDVMMIGLVSRLVDQKGLDLLGEAAERILQNDVQLVVLGTGSGKYEDMFRYFASAYPDKVSANICFSNQLAHRIYAASDLLLVPSRFEPCGLSQLIALRYGTLPLVRETGGLKDTVVSYNEQTGEGNGFSFANCDSEGLLYTVNRAHGFYADNVELWRELCIRAMKCNYSWRKSSRRYVKLYSDLLGVKPVYFKKKQITDSVAQ